MNKLKKVFSTFLASSLIFSFSTTASAEVTSSAEAPKQNSVYCETFGESGAVEGLFANYADNYKTHTKINPYLKEDGDYAGEIVTKTVGTTNNYGDVRRVFGKNIAEDSFSITYDINFLEYEGLTTNSGLIIKMSTRNYKRSGGTIWGYGTNLFGVGSSSDKVKIFASPNGAELDTGKWYKVKQQFDGNTHKEVMTVTDPLTDDIITTIERSIHVDFTGLEMFNFTMYQASTILLDNVSVNSDKVSVSGIEEIYTTTDDITFEAIIPEGFGTASLYANDDLIGTIDENGTNCYTITIPAGDLAEGDYDLVLEASVSGTSQTASASFKVSDEMVILSPTPGSGVLDGELFLSATAPKNLNLYALIDNIHRADLVPDESDPGLYSAVFDVSEGFSMGKHKVLFVAERPDGSTLSGETDFSLNTKVFNKSVSQDFNSLGDLADTITDDNKAGIMNKVGFMFGNESGADLTVIPGPSGEPDDFAAQIQIATDKSLTASAPFIRSTGFTNYNKGITEFEFDIKLTTTTNTQLRITNLYLWDEAILFLVDGGKWAGTSVKATTEWTHIKYITDADKRTISMEIDGVRAIDNAPYGKRSEYKNTQFDITPLQIGNVPAGGKRTGFAIDNFSAVNYNVYRGITSVGYLADGVETVIEETKVPQNAESLVVHVPNGLDASTVSGNVLLTTDAGEEVELSQISYSETDKTLILTPNGELPAGRNLTVRLLSALAYEDGTQFGTEYTYTFAVEGYPVDTKAYFEKDGEKIYAVGSVSADNKICADITAVNKSGASASVVYVLTLRSNNRIISMKAKTVEFSADETEKHIRLYLDETDADGNCELCLMTLNSYTDSNAIADYIKLN